MTSQIHVLQYPEGWICYGLTTLKTAILVTSIHWLASGTFPPAIVGMAALALTIFLPTLPGLRSPGFDAWLTISLTCHIVFGMNFDLYGSLPFYDKAAHIVVTAGLVIWCVTLLARYCVQCGIFVSRTAFCGIALILALSAGAAWEIFEFLIDRTGSFHAQRGLDDTMLDLVADLIGGGLAVALMTRSTPFETLKPAARNRPRNLATLSGRDN